MPRLGETFVNECLAAGVQINSYVVGETEAHIFAPNADPQKLAAVLAAHDQTRRLPANIPLATIQARMKAETVGTADGWSTYVDYMLPTGTLTAAQKARRNAFLETMFAGVPIRPDNAAFRNTLAGAGFTTAQADRVLAAP